MVEPCREHTGDGTRLFDHENTPPEHLTELVTYPMLRPRRKIHGSTAVIFLRPSIVVVLSALPAGAAFSHDLSFGSRDARPVPEWLHSASIYELWLNAFSKDGNLRGAIPGLKHIADLGATIVYLGPIAKRSADPNASPYSIADYNAIDPEAGSEQDLHDFVAEAHKLHLKVTLDGGYYH